MLLLFCFLLASPPSPIVRTHQAMGTQVSIQAHGEPARVEAAITQAFAEIDRLERAMSHWIVDSDISRLNAAAGQRPVPLGPDVFEVLRRSLAFSMASGGLFDVTFGVLSGLWKFDHDHDERMPDMAQVRARLQLIDYRKLRLDAKAQTGFLAQTGMRVSLGGIGKGYAVDNMAAVLRQHGLRDFLIQAGGDLFAAGKNDGRPWRVGLRDPRGATDQWFAALDVGDETFSTSGDYERSFLIGNTRYHHILNPKTGEPARGCRSVSIVAKNATDADGWATVVFLLGRKEGAKLIENLPDVEGVIVDDTNVVWISSGMKARLQLARAPTNAP